LIPFRSNLTTRGQDYSKIIEHFDYHAVQKVGFAMFAGYLKESIDFQQLNADPVDYIMGALKSFVETTFQFCAAESTLDLPMAGEFGKDGRPSSEFGNFVKLGWEKQEESVMGKSFLSPKLGSVEKTEGQKREKFNTGDAVTLKAEPADDSPQPMRHAIKAENGNDSKGSGVLAPPKGIFVDLTVDDDSSCIVAIPPGDPEDVAEAHRDIGEPIADSPTTALTDVSESQTQSLMDGVAEWQLREILNYSFHSILGSDLDSIANSRLLYDTLIDLADEFAGDLIKAAITCNNATVSEGHNDGSASSTYLGSDPSGVSSRKPTSSRRHSGGRDDGGHDGNEDSSGKKDRQSNKPSTSSKAKGAGVRLPCPFRMMYPGAFNVRTHYSCSMTYFPTIGRLKDHLREHHKRQDGAEVLCPRCFAGFSTREELHQHSQADIICRPSKFDPKIGLHGEAINLLRGRDRAGQSYLAQWREICNIIFQDDRTVPPPEYHAVMEHFEFAEEFVRSFPDLLCCLHPVISGNDAEAVKEFGAHAASIFIELYRLGADNSRLQLAWQSRLPTAIGCTSYSLELQNLGSHCLQLLRRFADHSRSTTYENDGSRGNGGRRSRQAANPPESLQLTPVISQPSPRDALPSGPPLSLCQDIDGERVRKRPRLQPVLGPARRPPILQRGQQMGSDLQSSTPPSTRPGYEHGHGYGCASLVNPLTIQSEMTSNVLEGSSIEAGGTAIHNTKQPQPPENSFSTAGNLPFSPSLASPGGGGLIDFLIENWDMEDTNL